jgi:acyl-CoA thioesterase FadM
MSSENSKGAARIVVQRRIEWSDTDASGHWHNTAGFRLIEVAETALLERLGILDDVYDHLPRVHIDASFPKALQFRDIIDCSIEVVKVGSSSITYAFEIRRGDDVCMTADVSAVLLGPDRRPQAWSVEHRALLLEAGPQGHEVLSTG